MYSELSVWLLGVRSLDSEPLMLKSSNIWTGNGGPDGRDGQHFKCRKK